MYACARMNPRPTKLTYCLQYTTLRSVTVNCPCISPTWGKLGKVSLWAHKGTTMAQSVTVFEDRVLFIYLYTILQWFMYIVLIELSYSLL